MAVNPVSAVWQILKEEKAVYDITRQRVYPNILPSSAGFPSVVYGQVSENRLETKDASIADGWRFQLELYAKNYAQAQELAQNIKSTFEWFERIVKNIGFVRIRFVNQDDAVYEEEKEAIKIVQDYSLKIR